MLAVIQMRYHRHNGTDTPSFCCRWTREDRNISAARKVARTADTVHHLRTTDMRRVYISVNIRFDSRVHRNDTDAANYLRTVGYFRRTEYQLVAEEIHIIVNILQTVVCHTERTGTAKFNSTLFYQINDRILNDLRIHFKRWNAGVFTQRTEHCIGNVSYARLQRQEGRRNNPAAHVRSQEIGNVLTDLIGYRVRIVETTCFIRKIHLHHSDNLCWIYLNIRQSDAVARTYDRNRTTIRRTFHFVQVMHSDQTLAVSSVQLYNHAVGQAGNRRRDTHSCRQINPSVGSQFTSFDNCRSHVSQKPGTQTLRYLRQMYISIINLSGIHSLTEINIRCIWCTKMNSMSTSQHPVARISRRSSRNDSYLKLFSPGVFLFCLLGKLCRNGFRTSCRCKPAQGDYLSIFYQAGSFGCGHNVIIHGIRCFYNC